MISFASHWRLPPTPLWPAARLAVPLRDAGRQALTSGADAGGFPGTSQEQNKRSSVWIQFSSSLLAWQPNIQIQTGWPRCSPEHLEWQAEGETRGDVLGPLVQLLLF